MAGIIKAGRLKGEASAIRAAAFQFGDMNDEAAKYLQQVKREASELLEEARRQAEAIRRQAAEQGRQAAREAAEQTIHEELDKQLATVLPALAAASRQIELARQEWIRHWESHLVNLSVSIAEKVIRREVAQSPEITLEIVRETLELAAGGGTIRLHLNPQDFAKLGDRVELLSRALGNLGQMQIESDAHVTAGGCVVRTEFGEIDQRIETQLQRIQQELDS